MEKQLERLINLVGLVSVNARKALIKHTSFSYRAINKKERLTPLFFIRRFRRQNMKYRKKPVVIEAVQWTGLNLDEIKKFVGKDLQYDIIDTAWEVGKGAPYVIIKIHTLKCDHECTKGDYIIKGVNGEFNTCKPDVFAKTYEAVE
ncbi:hypothetical protein V8Q34_14660 [Blautia sp. JLR.GB0024]|uniref:hypothetical protein n=1 Tax=Blautia sp. JLR.GB0024 TaxID=3123295 RepID=UPI003007BC9C